MNKFCQRALLAAVLVIAYEANAAGIQLQVSCKEDDAGAEVYINGELKGGCPLDIEVPAGLIKLRVVEAVDENNERVFEKEIRVGKGAAKNVAVVLTTRQTAAAKKMEIERAEAAKREVRKQAELVDMLAKLRQQGVEAGNGKSFRDCPECLEMVLIPPGSFEMGSKDGEDNEKPAHQVTFKKIFAMGKTEVTQGQWRAVMGNPLGNFNKCGDDCPVEEASWQDAQAFIKKLNALTGKQYRLPSEAEWEYACRAGKIQQYCGSDDIGSVAWYGAFASPPGNSVDSTHLVATKQANDFGLYDMSGNVWEWVEDSYHDSYDGAPTDGSVWSGDGAKHLLRGGSWYFKAQFARAVGRNGVEPELRDDNIGFRVARTLP